MKKSFFLRRNKEPWPGSSAGQSAAPTRPGRTSDSQSGHAQESAKECVNYWRNESTFPSLCTPSSPLPLSQINVKIYFFERKQQRLQFSGLSNSRKLPACRETSQKCVPCATPERPPAERTAQTRWSVPTHRLSGHQASSPRVTHGATWGPHPDPGSQLRTSPGRSRPCLGAVAPAEFASTLRTNGSRDPTEHRQPGGLGRRTWQLGEHVSRPPPHPRDAERLSFQA